MKLKRSSAVVLVLTLALLSAGFQCDRYKKAASLSRDFAAGVSAFQDAEIILHNEGKISNDEHQTLETLIIQTARAGKVMDQAIQDAHNGKTVQASVDAAAVAASGLLDSGVTQVKNPEAQAELKSAALALKTIVDSILAVAS